jgi:hypothetical protein
MIYKAPTFEQRGGGLPSASGRNAGQILTDTIDYVATNSAGFTAASTPEALSRGL